MTRTLFLLSAGCLMLFFSCSTYVPVEYRQLGEFGAPKNAILNIASNEDKGFIALLQSDIVKDGWWKIDNGSKGLYELTISNLKETADPSSETTTVEDGKTYRSASYSALGSCDVSIKKQNEATVTTFTVSAEGYAQSEKEIPKSPGKSSLRPFFTLILGGKSEIDQAIEWQNSFLSIDAVSNLEKQLSLKIIDKITPVKKTVKIELEDSHDDMKPLKKFLEDKDYQSAFNYLTTLSQKETRSDILYNLGIVYELRQMFAEGCDYYTKAYALEAKTLYLEQKSGCETRLSETVKVNKLN